VWMDLTSKREAGVASPSSSRARAREGGVCNTIVAYDKCALALM
jgi:hypothetical protein